MAEISNTDYKPVFIYKSGVNRKNKALRPNPSRYAQSEKFSGFSLEGISLIIPK